MDQNKKSSLGTTLLSASTSWIGFGGGALSGLISDGCTHPIDTVRTRLMTNPSFSTNSLTGFGKILRTEGIRALYRGFSVVALFTTPAHALYFGFYDMSKSAFVQANGGNENSWIHFLSGSCANLAGGLIWTPQDVIKQRQQAQTSSSSPYSSIRRSLSQIIKSEGSFGLWKGYWLAALTYVPFTSLYFTLYEGWKTFIAKRLNKNRENLPIPIMMMGSASSSAFSATLTTPMDIVKTRVQVQNSNPELQSTRHTTKEIFKAVLQEAKTGKLYKLAGARIMWITPNCMLGIVSYDAIKRLFLQTYTSQESTK